MFRKNKVGDENTEASDFLNKFGLGNNKNPPNAENPNGEPEFNGSKFEYLRTKYVLDTKDEFYYYWLGIVSCAFAYNLIVVIGEFIWLFFSSTDS